MEKNGRVYLKGFKSVFTFDLHAPFRRVELVIA